MKRLVSLVVLTLTAMTSLQAQSLAIKNWEETMNYSGKTRMLSQRIAALYGVQSDVNIPTERRQEAREKMLLGQKEINDIYFALLAFEPIKTRSEALELIRLAQAHWRLMETAIFKTPSLESFRDVLAASDNLLLKNEEMTAKLESLSDRKSSEIINIAGRQRMFSQRLLRNYLAASMGIEKRQRLDALSEISTEFESAMLVMEGSSLNTDEIKGAISSISKMEWRKVYKTVTECVESNGAKFNVLVMIEFCETLLRKADRLTKLYTDTASS